MAINFSNTTPAAPAGYSNILWQSDSNGNVSGYYAGGTGNNPYDVVCSYVGKPGAGATVLILTFTRTVSFPGNFAGSAGTVGANPAASATYLVNKNGTQIGTVVISTSGTFSFTTTSGAAQSFAAGDRLTVTAPASQDSTLSDVAITFAGTR